MREVSMYLRGVAVLVAAGLLLAGCSSKAPAPLESRSPSRVAVEQAPVVARAGHYIVKKGDTLYSIAHQHDRDYRELAVWNGLTDPNVISAGQELRVVPPGEVIGAPTATSSVTEAKPVPLPASIVSSGASTPAASAPVAASSPSAPVGQKTEPKGGRLAYSEQAWKDLQTVGQAPVAAVSAPTTNTAQSQPAAEKPTASKTPVAANEDSPDWVWPGAGKVIASFNDSSNKGIDLAGNIGDPVVAAGPGRVVYVGSGLRGYGSMVIIKHNNNFLSAYAHNSEILVKEGQDVQKGQKIAALGNSDADRPKLHFEIRRQGKPVDPMKYLPAR